MTITNEGLTITQAAESLGVSTRTVRRFIKAGKLKAELVPGPFGEEYRIPDIPEELRKSGTDEEKGTEDVVHTTVQSVVQSAEQPMLLPAQAPAQVMDIINSFQEKNLALAAQLGAATERIRQLENQIRLLSSPRLPWWKRLFRRD